MVNNILYSNIATEILEICSYLDEKIFLKIPKKVIENLNNIKNENHIFKIDKTKTLDEQNMLKETREIFSILFLKYCCTKEEAEELIKENRQRNIAEENEKNIRYNTESIFRNNTKNEIKQDTTQIVPIEEKPFYLNIIDKIKKLFSRIFGKKEK